MTTTEAWIDAISAGSSLRQVAITAHLPAPTIARQVRENTLSPENVVAIARAYDASPLDGLVATGLLRRDEVGTAGILDALRAASDEQLVEEVSRRLHDAAPVASVYSMPMSEADVMLAARDSDDDAEAEAQTEDA